PFDLSAFYCRRMAVVRAAFSLTPEYLRTPEAADVKNLMDTGVQLGRRFRSLKLWMILRSFGARALRARLAEHIRLAQELASWIDAHPDFERLAPVPFSVVCFRCNLAGMSWSGAEADGGHERLLLRSFGARALRARLAEHIRLAQELASWIDAHPDFERLAPVPFSVVCFRWKQAGMSWSDAEVDAANERLLDLVNASGDIFLSHT